MFELRTFGLSSLSQDVCPCKVCEYLSIAVDKVPYENNVKFLCAIGRVACCIDGCLPLSYCKVCVSVFAFRRSVIKRCVYILFALQ